MAKIGLDKIIIILTVVSAAMLQLIDSSIVNVSLTQMMGNLGATLGDISWVVTSYTAANVVMIALSGWLSAKFGRKQYFAASIILFTIASIFCGTATNVWELVFFRFVQGIGGGGLISTAQAILVETFPKEQLGMANAIYGMSVIIGPTIGPTLGGYITDHYSWHWIFFINIPIGMIATFLTLTFIKEPKEKITTGKMDWLGLALLVASIGALQVILEKGESEDWFQTNYITVLTITAVIATIGFIWRELSVKHPLVHLQIMKDRTFTVGVLFNFILGFGLYGSVFLVPVFAQNLLGFTATETGWLMMPGSIATAIVMPIIGKLLQKRFSPILFTGIGIVLFFVFSLMLSQSTLSSTSDSFFTALLIRGIAMGFIFIPLNVIILSQLSGKEIPHGTGLSNMLRQLGGSFGIALMATYINTRASVHRDLLLDHVTAYDPATQQRMALMKNAFISKGYAATDAANMALASLDGTLRIQSYVLTYEDAFMLVGVFFLICLPLLLLFRRKKKNAGEPVHIELVAE